jgi:hypothetical protein
MERNGKHSLRRIMNWNAMTQSQMSNSFQILAES